jgi:hypothetical protein
LAEGTQEPSPVKERKTDRQCIDLAHKILSDMSVSNGLKGFAETLRSGMNKLPTDGIPVDMLKGMNALINEAEGNRTKKLSQIERDIDEYLDKCGPPDAGTVQAR